MNQLTVNKYRVQSIDVLRGVVMIIMALDHVRDFFHKEAFTDDPLNLATTTVPLYFTRWITHFCAPIFVFLAGTSAYLLGQKKSKKDLSRFLISRGIWLILVEVAIITLGITFNPLYNVIIFQVIWAIGISMVILGILVWLPYAVILAIGCIIMLGHNALDYPEATMDAAQKPVGFFWDLLHHGRFAIYPFAENHSLLIVYAFLPWTGIMLMGYSLGKIFETSVDPARRRKILLLTGFGAIVFFVILRAINEYGNPFPWTSQRNGLVSFLAFLNINKYPPSLMYACITIGPGLIFLALIERVQNGFTAFAKIYGRVPFFYYVVHFYLIHALTVLAFFLSGYTTDQIVSPNSIFLFRPLDMGYDLWMVYLVWISVIIALFPLCRWYNRYKSTHSYWWLSYL